MTPAEYLAKSKTNIELMLFTTPDGITLYGIRIRPWKQHPITPQMILVMGETFEEALKQAAIGVYAEDWQELDWRVRPWDTEDNVESKDKTAYQLDFIEGVKVTGPRKVTSGYKDTSKGLKIV